MGNKKHKISLFSVHLLLLFLLAVNAQFNFQNEYLPGIKTKDEAILGMQKILEFLVKTPKKRSSDTNATEVKFYNATSSTVQDLKYHVLLCKSVNCRDSLDKWDCPFCKRYFPDIEVVRTFGTYPLDITGEILLSRTKKTIYLLVRGASMLDDQVDVPFIPGGKVQQGARMSVEDIWGGVNNTMVDLLKLYPEYRVHVIGHSYGALVASYLTLKLFHDIPKINSENLSAYLIGKPRVGNLQYSQYVKDNKIDIKRMVHLRDNAPHGEPNSEDYVHEGVEYWEISDKPSRTCYDKANTRKVKCEGDRETRECSNSLNFTTVLDHLVSYGVNLGCE
ncbi:alpha/beta-hydrolase [Backusella circina FSU 941]|nr:alpha/beta-hydrolase [Backusella circina FSU 941]